MKLPYNRLAVSGSILFASRGGRIHSFNTADGSYISTWQHPDVGKIGVVPPESADEEADLESASAANGTEPSPAGPPAKKQKLDLEDDVVEDRGESQPDSAPKEEQVEGAEGKKKKKKKGKRKGKRHRDGISHIPEMPLVAFLQASADGKHVVAVCSHDKVMFVFAHDRVGHLTELSKRVMTKRACDISITGDSQTIILADKFGDVYSFPLVPTEPPPPRPAAESAPPEAPLPVLPKPFRAEADTTTVHSRRNLRALHNQQRQVEAGRINLKQGGPSFERTFLLGHVSVLTALLLAKDEHRDYILTADRDEHIRVSRGIPQTHIIENFCLGHTEFVSAMTIPPRRSDILISGGGDNELFVWNWQDAKLLSTVDLLGHVQEVAGERLAKIAVTHLYSCVIQRPGFNSAEPVTCILAICEGIPALFCFELTSQGTVEYWKTITLGGNPLDLAFLSDEGGTVQKCIVALDPGEDDVLVDGSSQPTRFLTLLSWEDRTNTPQDPNFCLDSALEESEPDMSNEEVKKLLYHTEALRKRGEEAGEAGSGGDAEAEEQAASEPPEDES